MSEIPECIECGAPLTTMAAQSSERCHICDGRKRDAIKEKELARQLALEHLADMAIIWHSSHNTKAHEEHEAKLRKAIDRFKGLDGG